MKHPFILLHASIRSKITKYVSHIRRPSIKKSLYTSTDIEIIQLIKKILGVTNEIETYKSKFVNWKLRYTIQIGSKSIFKRFEQLGFTPNKSLTLSFPNIPDALLGHF